MALLGYSGGTPTLGGLSPRPTGRFDPLEESERRYREEIERRRRETVAQQMAEERERLQLEAMRLARDQALAMSANPANPRTSTGTAYNISSPPEDSVQMALEAQRRAAQRRGLPPEIEGRFLPLVNFPTAPTINLPNQVAMRPASFGPTEARELEEAEFAYQKARSGQMARAAIDSLRDELAGRGMLGSGAEFEGVAQRIAQSMDPLAALNVAQLGRQYEATTRERQLAEQARLAQYQGDIAQRAQDLDALQAQQALQARLALERFQAEDLVRRASIEAALRALQY